MSALVSIIVPVYNAAGHLEKCLASLCNQTYRPLEIILINDGSADDSGTIMQAYAERYDFVKAFSQKNQGVSAARNAGIRQSSGDYLLFVDSDDCVAPDYAEKLIHALETDGCGMAVCGFRSVEETTGKFVESHFALTGIQPRNVFIDQILRFRDITSALWNKAFLGNIVREEHLCFSQELAIGEDLCFLVDYALHIDKVNILSDVLYDYLINPGGAMASGGSLQKKQLTEWYAIRQVEDKLQTSGIHVPNLAVKKVRIADKLLSKIVDSGYDDPALRAELAKCLRENLMTALRSHDFAAKKKLSIALNAFTPGLRSALNRGKHH